MTTDKQTLLINRGFWYYVLSAFDKNYFSEKAIEKLTNFLDFNYIPPSVFTRNENLLKVVHRSNITSEKLASVIYYKPASINYIELDYFKFASEDVIGILVAHPLLLDYFQIKPEDFTPIQLIRIYSENQDLSKKIDFSKIRLEEKEIKIILSTYLKKRHVLDLIDLSEINNNQIRLILKEYGEEFINKLDIKKLKSLDWIDIFNRKPELLKYCDVNIFKKEGGNDLVSLVEIFEHLDYLIDENKHLLNALSIEKLIIRNPQKYVSTLDIKKLKDKNWLSIIKVHSYLKNKYIYATS